MIPYSTIAYYDQTTGQSWTEFRSGFHPIYVKDVKFSSDNGPLKLVHSSPSFIDEKTENLNLVFVYEINPNYVPSNSP
jgi:dolichyl-diphosphooligosaccharide--protein glycosyltransferase